MACSHTAACPLFPLLNSSLDGWRRCYCDSQDGWRACARYQKSVRGQYVPLSLLPNGHDAGHLRAAGTDHRPAADGPPGPEGALPSAGPTVVDLLFEPAPAHNPPGDPQVERLVPDPRQPLPGPRTPPPADRSVREPRPRRRPWWVRLAEWMRTPA
jgi:hypothetical protein